MKRKLLSLLLITSLFSLCLPRKVNAGNFTNLSDTMSRSKISTASDHTLTFTTASAFSAGDTLIVTFASGFSAASVAVGDVDLEDDDADQTLVAGTSPGAAEIGYSVSGQTVMTFTAGSSIDITAGSVIDIEIGTVASGGSNQVTNPGTAGSYQIALTGTIGDTGGMDVAITDDDQVSITASVDTYLLFDLDVAASHGDSDAPYSIALGELTFASITTATNHIFVDLDSNASGGTSVAVKDANAGLSSADAAYTIASASETLQASQDTDDGYGLQNGTWSATSGSWTESGTFDVAGDNVGALTTSFVEIANTTSAQMVGGSGEILIKAVAAKITPAADDYTDTLTFRAVGTY